MRAHRFEPMARGQSERLIPMANEVLEAADLSTTGLCFVAAGRGPGAFTGVRLCLAAARGLGLALGIPAVGVLSTEVVAAAQPVGPGPLLVAIDSKRGDFFTQSFNHAEPMRPIALDGDGIIQWTRNLSDSEGTVRVAGDAADAVLVMLDQAGISAVAAGGPDLPDAAFLARIAVARHGLDPNVRAWADAAPEPLYLRHPDVSAPSRDRARAPEQTTIIRV